MDARGEGSERAPMVVPQVGNATRAGIALGIALVFFSVFHLACGRLAIELLAEQDDGWLDLSFAVAVLLYGALAVLVLIPIAVFTVGLAVDVKTRQWPRGRAAAVHGLAGFILGIGVAGIAVAAGVANWPTAVLAFAVPSALAAFATHMVSPTAMSHRGIAWTAWALASVAIVASLVFVVSVFVL